MQLTKKDVIWGESGAVEKPNDVKIEEGWTGIPAEQPPAKYFNWILKSDEENINLLIDANNSVDTELSTLITAAGLTPDISPTGPGSQVLEAITQSKLIDTPGLADDAVVDAILGDDLDFGHFTSGVIAIAKTQSGLNYVWSQDVQGLNHASETIATGVVKYSQLRSESGLELWSSDNDQKADYTQLQVQFKDGGFPDFFGSTLNINELWIRNEDPAVDVSVRVNRNYVQLDEFNIRSRSSAEGTQYSGTDSPGDEYPTLRTAVIDLGSGGWTNAGSSPDITFSYTPTISDCKIPNGNKVLSASITYTNQNGFTTCVPASVTFSNGTTSTDLGNIRIKGTYATDEPDSGENQVLTVVFDGAGLN